MVEILVAEPNQMFRLGIRSVLESKAEFSITDEVASAARFRSAFLDAPHDVVLVELGLLKQIGCTALRELRLARPDTRFLVHSYEIDTDFGAEAFRFGATGYLANDCSASDLCAAVHHVAAGLPFITLSLGEQLATSVCFQASNLSYASLTRRELQVFKILSIGLKVTDAARQLRMSVDAIDTYKARIMSKMVLPGAGELVQHAIAQSVMKALEHPQGMRLAH